MVPISLKCRVISVLLITAIIIKKEYAMPNSTVPTSYQIASSIINVVSGILLTDKTRSN